MKKSAIAAALILTASAAGCRTTSKFPWITTASKTAAEAAAVDSTVVAHTAPALPSDLAKKGQTAAPSSAQVAGGEAAPWVPNANTTAQTTTRPAATNYPTTTAPAFSPEAAKQAAGSTVAAITKEPSSGNLGSIAMRYDPAKAPQTAPTTATAQATAPTTPNRYGTTSTAPAAAAGQRTSDVIASTPSFGGFPAGSRYGVPAAQPEATAQASVAPVPASAPAQSNNGVVNPGNRYAQAAPTNTTPAPNRYANTATPASANVAVAPAAGTPSTTPKTVEVAAAPKVFRPGGTSTYPSVPSLASRPQTGASSTTSTPASGSAASGSTSTPAASGSTTTTPSRYW